MTYLHMAEFRMIAKTTSFLTFSSANSFEA